MKTGNESQCDFFLNNALSCLGVFVCFCSVKGHLVPATFAWKLRSWVVLQCLLMLSLQKECWFCPFERLCETDFSYAVHSVTFHKDVWTWLFLCVLGECGEWNFPPAVSHIPVHIGGPVLGPPVKCLHLCVHIPQPVSLSAPAFNHRPPEAQKYHLLQFLLPGVSKRRWEFFHQLGSLQYFLAKVHFFKPFLLNGIILQCCGRWSVPSGEVSQEAGTSGKKCPFCSFSLVRPCSPPPSALISFSVHDAFSVNVGVDADRNACMVKNFTQIAWWTWSWLLGGAGHPVGHRRPYSPEAALQRKLDQGSALLFLLQNHETNGASRNWQNEVWAM